MLALVALILIISLSALVSMMSRLLVGSRLAYWLLIKLRRLLLAPSLSGLLFLLFLLLFSLLTLLLLN